MSLHPNHLADLQKSGLTDETIREAGIYSVPPRDINKKLGQGFPHPEKINSLLAFPYPGSDFGRYKLFPPLGDRKYHQREGTGNRLYIPQRVTGTLRDISIPLYITEGEKKALRATQEGLSCIGMGGLWNWSDGTEGKSLIPDFDLVEWRGRTVYIVPDNDWEQPDRHGEKKNLRQAVYELGYRLIDRGAKVSVIELPQGQEKGLDDFLCHHSVEEFNSLPKRTIRRQTLDEMIAEASLETLPDILKRLSGVKATERAVYINRLSKKLDIPKRAIQHDLKDLAPAEDEGKVSTAAYFPGLIDMIENKEGKILFLVNKDGVIEGVTVYEMEGNLYKPPEKAKIPFSIPRAEEVGRWMNEDKTDTLFHDVLSHLKRFSYLPDHQFIVVACYVFLTYIQDHLNIHYFPMLLFWSAPERGKSRTGKAVAACSFRGIHVVDLREANLFRYSQDFRATLFIDVMDLWKKTEKNGSEDILLLRYEKGAKVARVLYPEKGPLNDMIFFDVYGPTIMASNEPVHHILDTRCIPIAMQNRPGTYENPTAETALEIRERLTAWRASAMGLSLPNIQPIPGVSGRLWDISEPLFQVCQMVAPSHMNTLENAILEIAGARVEDKQDTLDGQVVGILKDLSADGPATWEIPLQTIVDRLNEKRPEGHKLKSRYVGQRVKGLSIPKTRRNDGVIVQLTRGILNTLLDQFGFKYSPEPTPGNTFTTYTTFTNAVNSGTCEGEHSVNVGEPTPECSPRQCELFQGVKDVVNVVNVPQGGQADKKESSDYDDLDITDQTVEDFPFDDEPKNSQYRGQGPA
jgi:hypothetical protein